jgi:hypothetical protein
VAKGLPMNVVKHQKCTKYFRFPRIVTSNTKLRYLEVCHPVLCVCENWKGYVVKHNYVN